MIISDLCEVEAPNDILVPLGQNVWILNLSQAFNLLNNNLRHLMPDYTTYAPQQLIQVLENQADYEPDAIKEVLTEWETRGIKRKDAKKIAEDIVRDKIRRFLSRKSRLLFNPRNMEFPASHFLSEKAVKRVFGEEYKRWKERKKLFGDSSHNADPSLF
ncbi:MAG: hypothetical protein AAFR59_10640 [Bacteroidota bacterium]